MRFIRKIFLFIFFIELPIVSFAKKFDNDRDYFNAATYIDSKGDEQIASQIYYNLVKSDDENVSIDSALVLAQKFVKHEQFKEAIKYYQWILQQKPDYARVRFELALCYIKLKYWNMADYQLRLALSSDNLSDEAKNLMLYYRYLIRKNKNWNVWFNVGAAPDNNINNANGGQECILTTLGVLCRNLQEPESAVGFNALLGGYYDFTLTDKWHWKSEANIYTNIYDKHKFDDLFLSTSTGPRYVWQNGDLWLAGVVNSRWFGWEKYNSSYGAKLEMNYDFTRKISGGVGAQYLENKYHIYPDMFNGQTYAVNTHFSYSFKSNLYSVFKTGFIREDTKQSGYSYWQPNVGVGFGTDVIGGFHVYIEPMFYWTYFDGERLVVRDNVFTNIIEKDFIQRYSLYLSNNKYNYNGFVPTMVIAYTKRDSNVWQQEYKKTTIEFRMQRRF